MASLVNRGGNLLERPVRLSVPAARDHVRVARLTAAVVAERLDFDIDEIDDVLVAVDELTNAIIQARPTSEIEFQFAEDGGAFVADADAEVAGTPTLGPLARQVLLAVVDDFELTERAGHAHFRLHKRVPAA